MTPPMTPPSAPPRVTRPGDLIIAHLVARGTCHVLDRRARERRRRRLRALEELRLLEWAGLAPGRAGP